MDEVDGAVYGVADEGGVVGEVHAWFVGFLAEEAREYQWLTDGC